MLEIVAEVLTAFVVVAILAYPFVHLPNILSGAVQYSRARVTFLVGWMFVAAATFIETAAVFVISLY
jgi:hypothetical protein